MLPYAGENAIWGGTLEYNLDIFMLLCVVALGFGRPGGWIWWLGWLAAVMGLISPWPRVLWLPWQLAPS